MAREGPEVSVLVPCWNAAQWLAAGAASALGQTLADLELILVDDASTDGTVEKARRFAEADPRVRLVLRPVNGGSAAARNDGLACARGRWIALLDADDRMAPERLDRMVKVAEAVGADWLADDQWIEAEGTGWRAARLLLEEPAGASPLDPVRFLDRDPPETIGYGTLKPLIRRDFLLRSGVRFRPEAGRSDDFLFAVDCMAAGAACWLLAEPLYHYRLRPDSQVTGTSPLATLDHMLAVQSLAERSLAAHPDPRVGAALARRRARIELAALYRRALDAARRGELAELARLLGRQPALLGLLARGLGEAVVRRLRGDRLPTLANRPLFWTALG